MRIKLVTTVTTYIETTASIEEARKEILQRLCGDEDYDSRVEDVQCSHSSAVCFDEVVKTSTETKLVVADE